MKKLLLATGLFFGLLYAAALGQNAGWPPPAGSQAGLGVYNTTPPTLTNGQVGFVQVDSHGDLLVAGASTLSGSSGMLAGCQFLSNGISPANGGIIPIQCDQYGRVIGANGTANQATSDPTIQAAAYAINNCIGGFNSVTVTTYNGQPGFLTNIRLTSIAGTAYQLMGYVFDSQPTTSTCTDKGTFSVSAADVDKIIGVINATTLAVTGGSVTSPTHASIDYTPPRPFRAGGSGSSGVSTFWYGLALAAAATPTSTSDLHLRFGILRD